jgi:periplasmic divalent cation tolerance protein
MARDALTRMDTDCIVVLVTVGSRQEGERIASAVVGEQLAACVNIVGPIESIYRWDDQVRHDQELLLVIKSRSALFGALAARVTALHSYQTPEVIAVSISAGPRPYLDWLCGATGALKRE